MNEVWEEPKMSDRFICDNGEVLTWMQLTEGVEEPFYPRCKDDYETLLWCFGAVPLHE